MNYNNNNNNNNNNNINIFLLGIRRCSVCFSSDSQQIRQTTNKYDKPPINTIIFIGGLSYLLVVCRIYWWFVVFVVKQPFSIQ